MNSKDTQISRKKISAPTKWIIEHYGDLLKGKDVMHYGEGKAFPDTRALWEAVDTNTSGSVVPYDPNSPDRFTRNAGVLDWKYDITICNYVFNTLEPADRKAAFDAMPKPAFVTVRAEGPEGESFEDGVITKRGTFQKAYTGNEFIEEFHGQIIRKTSSYILGIVY